MNNQNPLSASGTQAALNGCTRPLFCTIAVVPMPPRTAEIAVADATYFLLDSGVFLDMESSGGGYLGMTDGMQSACIDSNKIDFAPLYKLLLVSIGVLATGLPPRFAILCLLFFI